MVNLDKWGEVINGTKTYEQIAYFLRTSKNCIIGWTDEQGTHYDILFTLKPIKIGTLQRGLHGDNELFISIVGGTTFGFKVNRANELDESYIAEKLMITGKDTIKKISDLINGVIDNI